MFLTHLLIVFLLIPLLLVVGAVATPVAVRFWILFLLFPVGLMLFALWRFLRERGGTDDRMEGRA